MSMTSLGFYLLAALLIAVPGRDVRAVGWLSSSTACPGDCDDDGVVSVTDLVIAVNVALGVSEVAECAAADSNEDGAVTVDELVLAVNAALGGCGPLATATQTATSVATTTRTGTPGWTATVTATRTTARTYTPFPTSAETPTGSRTASATPTQAVTQTATASETMASNVTPTASATRSATDTTTLVPTATSVHTGSVTETPSVTLTRTRTRTDMPTRTASSTGTPTVTRTWTATATNTATLTSSRSATPTVTPTRPNTSTHTATATPSNTPTRTVLATSTGTSSPIATSTWSGTPTPTITLTATSTVTPTFGPLGTRHFSLNPESSSFVFVLPESLLVNRGFEGYLELTGGTPDPVTGQVVIDITAASEFISLDLNPEAAFTVCIRPLMIPVLAAGIIDCDGGSDLGVAVTQNHHVGEVGVGGFTETDCINAGGLVEAADDVHPNVCNGPLEIDTSGESDSGAGALKIGLDEESGLQGLPAELTVEESLPCGDEGLGVSTAFGAVSALSRATILNSNDELGEEFTHEERGENFSCHDWTVEDGPGRLVVGLPALHGFLGVDMISLFIFED